MSPLGEGEAFAVKHFTSKIQNSQEFKSHPDMSWHQILVQILRDKDIDIHQPDQGMCGYILHYLPGIHLSLGTVKNEVFTH